MQLKTIPVSESIGATLVHNIAGADGRKVFSKGHLVRAEDVEPLRALGKASVYVALLDTDDVREDDAATRIARAVAGDGVAASQARGGRVNFVAARSGFVRVNARSLKRLNEMTGVTLATIPKYTRVAPKKLVATLKTIGLALPARIVRAAGAIAQEFGVAVSVAPALKQSVAIVLTGSENGRSRVQETFAPPLRARIEEAGARVIMEEFVAEDEAAIADALARGIAGGAQIIILAGETSIMDAGDIAPRGIQRAGGKIELYGAPVEPGNLLLLAYRDGVPIIGAPGCVRSRATNVVDLILPPLLLGERVTRAEVVEMAEGGLLIANGG